MRCDGFCLREVINIMGVARGCTSRAEKNCFGAKFTGESCKCTPQAEQRSPFVWKLGRSDQAQIQLQADQAAASPQELGFGAFTVRKCTKFVLLTLRIITKIVAIRCQILRLKCTKFDFGWGAHPKSNLVHFSLKI